MKTPIIAVTVAICVLVVAYLAYDLLRPAVNRCESVFEQTTVSLGAKLKLIETEGEILLGREKVQELGERAQETALHLKTCCIALDSGGVTSEQFLQCQQTANAYVESVESVATSVEQASTAKAEGQDDVVQQQLARIEALLRQAAENSERLDDIVRELPQQSGGDEVSAGTRSGSEPGTLRLAAALAPGGEPVESCFEVYEPTQDAAGNRQYLDRLCGQSVLFTLAPGSYFVRAESGYANTSREVVVQSTQVTDESFDLNAGYLRAKAVLAQGTETVDSCFDIYEAVQDLQGNRRYVTRDCGLLTLFTLPAGLYRVTAVVGDASKSVELEIQAGQLTDNEINLEAGYLRIKAVPAEDAPPIESCFDIYEAKQDLQGNRRYINRNCGEMALFILAAGAYHLLVSSGDATMSLDAEVKTGDVTDELANLDAGYLRLRAVLSNGAPPLDACFDVYDAKQDLRGDRRYINRACTTQAVFTLSAGGYFITTSYGHARKDQELQVRANEVADATIDLNAGTLRLSTATNEGGTPNEACFDIYLAKQDLHGNRPYVDRACGTEVTFTVNADDYFILASQGERQATREASVVAGETVDLVIDTGQAQ